MTRFFVLNVLTYLASNQPHPGFHGPSQPFLSCLPPLHAPQALLGDVHHPKVDVLHSWAVVMRSSFSCSSMHQVIHIHQPMKQVAQTYKLYRTSWESGY